MAESILVTGKKISSMELVTNVTGNEKIPTGQPDDLALTPNQIADHTIARGDLASQEDLSQVEVSLGTQISEEEAARIAADSLKVDKEGSVSSVAGRVGDVVLVPSDVLVEGFGSQEDVNKYVPKPFLSGYSYRIGERVVLSSGEIVESTVDGNVSDPNTGMDGWVSTIADRLSNTVRTFLYPEAGVDPVTGVADGAYFNVRPTDDERFLVEYQNVAGVPTPTGRSSHNSQVVDQLRKGIKSVNELRLTTPSAKGDRIYLVSVNEDQGEGGGEFIATQKSGLVDDGGLVIASPNPLIFWVRINYDYVTPEMFGAVGNDITKDDAIPLQKAFSHRLPARLHPKRYFTSMPIYYQSAKEIQGLTELDCRIIKTTNNTLNLGNQTINGKVMNFDIDAVIIGMPRSGDWYCQQNHISGFKAEYYSLMPTLGIGMYVPLLCLSTYKNIQFNNVSVGLKTVESWMVTWERIQCNAKQTGFLIGAEDTNWQANSTSQVFTACWAVGCQEYAWDVRFMQYSTMISCASDHTGTDGAPAKALYRFKYSDVDLIKCGAETVHAYQLFSLLGSRVKVTNFNGQLIWNKYLPTTAAWDNSGAMISVTSNSQLEIDGGSYDFRYNSSNAPGGICSAAAYVEGGSLLKINRSAKVAIEKLELNSYNAPPRDMGLFYTGDASIDVDLNIITTRRGSLFNNKQNHTQQALNYNTFSTAQANPSTFRGYGASFLSSAFTATNTTTNGYPDNGNVHVIQQIGTVTGNRLNYAARLDFSMWDGGGRMYVSYGYYDKEYTNWAQVWTSADSIPQSATRIGKEHLTTTGEGAYDIGSSSNKFKRAWLTNLNIGNLSVFADNAAAKTAGLVNGEFYRTSTGQVMVVF